ncbi:MAG: tRNA uridine-5-carboxymethylaminomethyl(34) synthesis GTPase MnmE [Methylocystaceae bacterium]|nr:MAG: tRNA uridine-5-carboxymethylaminomethyl(34) synthesis GTPase MnmE [Methylocystaceae bacterium]
MEKPETIFALATGMGRSAIAVIRLSGPSASVVIEAIAGSAPVAREARPVYFHDPESREVIDRGLLLWFPGPNSVTGEDYAEFQIHGGRAVVDQFSRVLSRFSGLRVAEPGEFARRGLANGKMDLSQVEGLADLIDAETEFQRRQAMRTLGGALRRRVEGWRSAIVQALALVEAELDFSDEGDVEFEPQAALGHILRPMLAEMQELRRQAPSAERLRDGFVVLILGPPNSGKSTLLNMLAKRDVAIVSAIPGTTRDMIEVHLDLHGMPVTLVDTAGLREAADEIERLGVARSLARAEQADLILWLSEGGRIAPPDEHFGAAGNALDLLYVSTKADIFSAAPGHLAISAQTGLGLDSLFDEILERAKARLGDGSTALLTRQRHRELVEKAESCVASALLVDKPLEFAADDLRAAGRALGRIVGAVDVEQILDAIFAQFCIGK